MTEGMYNGGQTAVQFEDGGDGAMADWIMVDKVLISSTNEGTDWAPSLGDTSQTSQIPDLKTFSKNLFLNVK